MMTPDPDGWARLTWCMFIWMDNAPGFLLDDGSQINSVTPAFAKSQGFAIGPLEQLAGRATGTLFQGVGGTRTGALRYVVF